MTTSWRGAVAVATTALFVLGFLGLVGAPAAAADPAAIQAQEWWFPHLGVTQTWQLSKGDGVTVAVLDSGVDGTFGDLQGALVPGFVSAGSGNGQTDTDPAIHGTRIADEIAGRGTGFGLLGMAPKAKILPVVVPLDDAMADNIASALNRFSAMAHPPQVVNMSIGTDAACPSNLQSAVRTAVDKGTILVAAAGNDGGSTNESQYPANCAGVVAVGAVDQNGSAWSGSERQPYVALAGPGVHMIGLYKKTGGIAFADGTSDSSAIVSGVFALLRTHFPTMPSRELVARVMYTAHQFQGTKHVRNTATGFGVALPYQSLTARVPASAPNPVYDELDKIAGEPSTGTSSAPDTSSSHSSPVVARKAGASAKSGSSTGVLLAVAAAIVIVLLIILALVLRSRRRRPVHSATYPGGYGPPPGP